MSVKVFAVEHGSVCGKKKICAGDNLISINGNEINDVLDFRFYAEGKKLNLKFNTLKGRSRHITLRNIESCDDLGLGFETYLMDKHRSCKNHCIFCFIDQLPKGLRKSLYFKDDDSRLSFLFGNYITLTNLSEHDVERIINMHISPLNASVHTMNPELRVKMMRNPHAGESLSYLKRFSDAGIKINTQLVLCPEINDGEELTFSLEKLSELENVVSIAAVPVGLTKYRDGLYPLKKYTKRQAGQVIDIIDSFNSKLQKNGREKLAFPSDEFFLLANRSLPAEEYYVDFPQLDNGVGLLTLTRTDFLRSLADMVQDGKNREFAVATGESAFSLIKELADAFSEKFAQSTIRVCKIKNIFFGEDVTVAGLITGKDLIEQLKRENFSCDKLLLPSVMFKSSDERVFLDDVKIEDVERELNTKVIVTDCHGTALAETFFEQY